MRFLVDRCAGRRLADWLRQQGHDVRDVGGSARDPGDAELLRVASNEQRVLITIDTDFGALVYVQKAVHAGIIRLPDVPASARIRLMEQVLKNHVEAELVGAIVTVRGSRIRFSRRSS